MEAPRIYQKELLLIGGSTWNKQPRYRLHWLGDPIPGYIDRKFESPCDCWALIHWVDNDAEVPEAGGGYAVLQPFREGKIPCQLDSEGLNLNVIKMMAAMAERTRHLFKKTRAKVLEKRREREQDNEGLVNRIADYLHDRMPQFTGPTSFAHSDAGRVVLLKKMEEIERAMPSVREFAARFKRGPGVIEPNRTA